jgi:hypothetical protein
MRLLREALTEFRKSLQALGQHSGEFALRRLDRLDALRARWRRGGPEVCSARMRGAAVQNQQVNCLARFPKTLAPWNDFPQAQRKNGWFRGNEVRNHSVVSYPWKGIPMPKAPRQALRPPRHPRRGAPKRHAPDAQLDRPRPASIRPHREHYYYRILSNHKKGEFAPSAPRRPVCILKKRRAAFVPVPAARPLSLWSIGQPPAVDAPAAGAFDDLDDGDSGYKSGHRPLPGGKGRRYSTRTSILAASGQLLATATVLFSARVITFRCSANVKVRQWRACALAEVRKLLHYLLRRRQRRIGEARSRKHGVCEDRDTLMFSTEPQTLSLILLAPECFVNRCQNGCRTGQEGSH